MRRNNKIMAPIVIVIGAVIVILLLAHCAFQFYYDRVAEPFTRGIGESLLGRMLGPTGGGCCADQSSILADARPGEYNPMRKTWSERPSELVEMGESYRPSDEERASLNE